MHVMLGKDAEALGRANREASLPTFWGITTGTSLALFRIQ